MRVLLIGASGLIGSALATRLLSEKHTVIAAGRNPLKSRPGLENAFVDLRAATDAAAWLPLLANADAVINATAWTTTTGIRPRSLEQAMAARTAPIQDKWFARLYLLKPLIFTVFSLFWIATGMISLTLGWDIGIGLMHEGGVTGSGAPTALVAGAVADICIGVAIAFRRTARKGLYAALALSLAYLATGTILVPRLWIDPMGPMLKIWPVIALNLTAIALLESR
jgi:NAD(P)-dependent dehydrogenase (short-subunit alcohol dehydrogenase family)